MRNMTDLRLECVRLAVTMASSKTIAANDVMPRAMEFYRYVLDGDALATNADLDKLKNRNRGV